MHELYEKDGSVQFLEKLKNCYRTFTEKASENMREFLKGNRTRLENIEKFLEPAFLIYMGLMAADYIATYTGCKDPSEEATAFVRKLMENYGIKDGLLLSALADYAMLGFFYRTGEYIENFARKIDSEVESLPLFRKLLPYSMIVSAGAGHVKGLLSWL